MELAAHLFTARILVRVTKCDSPSLFQAASISTMTEMRRRKRLATDRVCSIDSEAARHHTVQV
jgi:hypothetical protein